MQMVTAELEETEQLLHQSQLQVTQLREASVAATSAASSSRSQVRCISHQLPHGGGATCSSSRRTLFQQPAIGPTIGQLSRPG